MLQKFKEKLQKAGFDADVLNYQSGCYCDGTDHGFYFKKLYVCPETWMEHEIAMKAAKRMLRGALKDEYIIEPILWSKAFTVVARKDAKQAEQAGMEGKIFLDTYHQYMHDHAPHENGHFIGDTRKYSDEAIEAAKGAVKKWKEGEAA